MRLRSCRGIDAAMCIYFHGWGGMSATDRDAFFFSTLCATAAARHAATRAQWELHQRHRDFPHCAKLRRGHADQRRIVASR
eukprot:246481-Rhodomonas_salina.2